MVHQDGYLVIIIRDHSKLCRLQPGTYFVIKLGNRVLRCDLSSNELVMNITKDEYDQRVNFIVFQRIKRKLNDPVGSRKRKLLDQVESDILNSNALIATNTRLEWRNKEIYFNTINIRLIVDFEFYSKFPIIPSKNMNLNVYSHLNTSKWNNLKKTSSNNLRYTKTFDNTFNLDTKVKKIYSHGDNENMNKHKKASVIDSETIIFDNNNTLIYKTDNLMKPCFRGYQHGYSDDQSREFEKAQYLESELYKFIKLNQYKKDYSDVLPIEMTPAIFFQNELNKFKFNQHIRFNVFTAENIKLTGYIGHGEWIRPDLSDNLLHLYIISDITFSGPPLPPKCPINMLWEEYYLINKNRYAKDVTRL